ncbi:MULTISPECIES: KinB-signaling pathway activation protein [Paenibacillus]|uniref:KinB-signaling pathway activation protein n=1 Tax=Paenibacillus TaxID=44249 RepID=UPI00088C43BD|nr:MULTISPECIES: KinB-signaling pathway activation protein [Paenibacillus]NTZ19790.1 KinB signaling pathway activation protein [Paenibacillus sp. JMULE4]SDJ50563.1 KinB signaling pathway activation protein [Paenibacillus naphthalenovorans]
MTIRKWFYLFWTTLLVGAVTAIVTGLVLQFSDQQVALGGKEIGFSMLTMFLGGATISVLSQMGFFAYLIIRYLFMGMFRRKWTWDMLQVIIIVIVLFDLVYLRYAQSDGQSAWVGYLVFPVILTIASGIVSWWKARLTNQSAWIPTLFFMIAVTAIEAIPSLRLDNPASTVFMLVPLFACNAWQILILSKVLQTNKEPL